MAARVLDGARRNGASLGVRVDDAVAVRRARKHSRSKLRAVPGSMAKASNDRETGRPAPGVQVQFRAPAKPLRVKERVTAAGAPGPTATVVAPMRSGAAEGVLASAPDPAFEKAVEQARDLTTAVRGRRSAQVDVVPTSNAKGTQEPAGYRLTTRGQRVLVALGFAISIGIGAIVGSLTGGEALPENTSTLVVQSGDSLWSIADVLVEPGNDLRPVIDQIAALNHLDSPLITAGQTLVVPSK